MPIGIRPATMADAHYLAPRLRPADKDEVLAVAGVGPSLALPECVRNSRLTWTAYGFEDARLVGMLGVQDTLVPEVGVVWMLCTSEIEAFPFHFLNTARELLPVIHSFHPIVTNHVDARNTVHIRWLRWMGFTFLRRIERWGAESRPFIEFARLQPPCA
jgi:hypothetical protein